MSDFADHRPWFLRRRIVIALVLTVAVMIAVALLYPGQLTVTVRNTGRQDMRDVIVLVTGSSHPLGNLPAGTEATTAVTPRSDSDVRIEFTDPNGTRRRTSGDCYIGPGFSGTIRVDMANGMITDLVDDTEIR